MNWVSLPREKLGKTRADFSQNERLTNSQGTANTNVINSHNVSAGGEGKAGYAGTVDKGTHIL